MLNSHVALAPDGQPFTLTKLQNNNGLTISLMDWGATWLSAILPLRDGERRELLLGCATPADYPHQGAYLGATVGRYANRIANARIQRNGQVFSLLPNQGQHQLHGGLKGSTPDAGRLFVRMSDKSVISCSPQMATRVSLVISLSKSVIN